MAETTNQQPTLGERDQWLRDIISTGEMPFLGLYTKLLDPRLRVAFRSKLSQSHDPLGQFLVYLSTCPALSLTYLTLHVCEGFGTRGTFEVYPFIEDALQLRTPLTSTEKEKLWSHYRKACIRLGLSVSSRQSGAHYMVEEYLRQSGVPLPYVAELTGRMLRYAKIAGLPDEDDAVSISTWQGGLTARLQLPFSKVAQRAISADDSGFYVRLFLRLLKEPVTTSSALSDFEILMSSAIHDQEAKLSRMLVSKGASLSIPQVVWRDSQLCVELPAGEGVEWQITMGDESRCWRGRIENHFVPLDLPLPPSVVIESTDDRGLRRTVNLWEDDRNNRLLVFSCTGLFIKGARLNSGEPLLLEPGAYHIVSRFIPEGFGEAVEVIRENPALYILQVLLEPGRKMTLSRGPALLDIRADSKPLLLWDGQDFKGVRGNVLYAESGLTLRAIVPEEYLVDQSSHFVRISCGINQATFPLTETASGDISINAGAIVGKWSPGVFRLHGEIYREGVKRPLVRSSVMVWIGLERVVNRSSFFCSALPSNLEPAESENLQVVSARKLITFRNEDTRFFRMVFNQDGKRFTFTAVVPGIFLQLQDHSQPRETVRSLKKGATLSVSWNSRCDLEIFSTCSGTLRLGSFSKRVDFSNCGCKRLPLSSLVEYLGPGSDILQFIDENTSYAEDLVRLVAPHEILSFSVLRERDTYKVFFSLAQEASKVALTATDIISGRTETLELKCNGAFERAGSGLNGWLSCGCDRTLGLYPHELRISLDRWPDGAWLLELDANINGRWGEFSNSRGDRYSCGFILFRGKTCTTPFKLFEAQGIWGHAQKMEILQRVHEKLMSCYSQESWQEVDWLQDLWQVLLSEFTVNDRHLPQLFELAEQMAAENAAESWIPMLSLSARLPRLYALPACELGGLSNKMHKLSIKCLKAMSTMEKGLLSLFNASVLDHIFARGFANLHDMAIRGAEPRQFSMKSYQAELKTERSSDHFAERLRLLRQDDWQPGEGDYLGALHYLYAMDRLDQFYQKTLPGNDYRRGKALYLCKHPPILDLSPYSGTGACDIGLLDVPSDEELTVHQENVLLIAQFLSIFARVCRCEARRTGFLDECMAKAKNVVGDDAQFECILGYLLYIGKDVFSFYLMLWEAVLISESTQGEQKTHVRKQPARPFQYS